MIPTALPEPELFTTASGEPSLGWGIVGPGWIAGEFATAVRASTAQRIVAVASRSLPRASAFAAEHGIEAAVEGVDALVARPDVDVVYIATPQSEHAAVALAAIAAGKHVLIEKPFTVTAAEARTVADAARAAGVLAMEGMWSRYLPQASVLRTLLADGALGAVRSVLADHGQAIPFGPDHRLFRPELGGGALLDLGIYAVQFASMVLGTPDRVTARGRMTESGVDASGSLVLEHGAAQAVLHTTIAARTPTTASIAGTEGTIDFAGPFYNPTTFTISAAAHGSPVLHWQDPTPLRGFAALAWEATALARFVGEGRTESPLHTLDETISILETVDTARAQIAAG
ncbi:MULTISPECIES: Gfo/Idh/MocA family protein [unclassified Curtobacterium]|uniref:Gfo/Idh/MocA family protein n=1 Tax=unclassified Curtobacterium TaxID=257496 RepID=UPI000F486423|nr:MULTISPECIES: Gfo/Idh/MocA family oxidoreductase [unclassified Curtobacterium]ROQ17392.1 putative dehydrogenase [Curtobacterium sp. PhB171]ROQ29363.1 putative dehydrogenase [Curtobacterium sp. PhB170]ROS45491.1 putative dehydrogenase [Curtobacterium sp. PhB131]ROS65801.1 putative dehydrogenase [Curtobacterium sp. PhB141]TCU50701.1 putative dehydrogenase [Curtobacterium sp. PhB146]